MIHPKRLNGYLVLSAAALGFLTLSSIFDPEIRRAIQAMLLWAGVEACIAFHFLFGALESTTKKFYSLFAAGALVRMASILLAALVLHSLHIDPTWPLIMLVFSYFVFSLLQIPFLRTAS